MLLVAALVVVDQQHHLHFTMLEALLGLMFANTSCSVDHPVHLSKESATRVLHAA